METGPPPLYITAVLKFQPFSGEMANYVLSVISPGPVPIGERCIGRTLRYSPFDARFSIFALLAVHAIASLYRIRPAVTWH